MSIYSRHITDFNVAGMRYWDGALVLDELKVGANLTMVVEKTTLMIQMPLRFIGKTQRLVMFPEI